ncbi:MAG: response regulator [Candidatus Wallbacteria bacterium]|nr:response regulator [Candidatus Wallbacteria bacterium]
MDPLRYAADILDSLTSGVMVVEVTSRLAYVNLEAARILKTERELLVGRLLFDLDGLSELLLLINRIRAARPVSTRSYRQYEIQVADSRGDAIPLGTSISSLTSSSGTVEGYVAVCRDLTEGKALMEQIEQSRKLSALGTMAGGVAHNFNNILGSILGRTQLLRRSSDPEKIQSGLKLIERAAVDGTACVRRIRDFSRKRDFNPSFNDVDVREMVSDVLAFTQSRWREQAQAKGIEYAIRTHFDEALPLVHGAASELREVLINLVLNSLDAMPGGGELDITAHGDRGKILLSVKDSGAGMSDEVLKRIFDPFFTTKGMAGTGLGLSESYAIVVRHRGQIACKSVEGKGTCFTITLPQAGSRDLSHMPSRGRVLLVDDDQARLDVLEDLLTTEHYSVETALGCRDALGRFEAGRFDLVVSEKELQEMTGDSLLVEVRRLDPTVRTILTGESAGGDCSAADLCLSRPLPIEVLLQSIGDVLEQKR